MKPIQLELKGFERIKPEPSNINDKARNIYIGIIDYMPELLNYIKSKN